MADEYLTEKLQEILVYTAPEAQPGEIAELVDEFIQGSLASVEDLVDAAREWKSSMEAWKSGETKALGFALQQELDAVAAEVQLKKTIENLRWHR